MKKKQNNIDELVWIGWVHLKEKVLQKTAQYSMQPFDNHKSYLDDSTATSDAGISIKLCAWKHFKQKKSVTMCPFFLQYVLCCDFLCASSLFRVNHVLCSSEIVWNLMLISCRFPTYYVELAHIKPEHLLRIRMCNLYSTKSQCNHWQRKQKESESKTRNSKIFN